MARQPTKQICFVALFCILGIKYFFSSQPTQRLDGNVDIDGQEVFINKEVNPRRDRVVAKQDVGHKNADDDEIHDSLQRANPRKKGFGKPASKTPQQDAAAAASNFKGTGSYAVMLDAFSDSSRDQQVFSIMTLCQSLHRLKSPYPLTVLWMPGNKAYAQKLRSYGCTDLANKIPHSENSCTCLLYALPENPPVKLGQLPPPPLVHVWQLPFEKVAVMPANVLMSKSCDSLLNLPQLSSVNWASPSENYAEGLLDHNYFIVEPSKKTFRQLADKWKTILPFSETVEEFIKEQFASSITTVPTSLISQWEPKNFAPEACVRPMPPSLIATVVRRTNGKAALPDPVETAMRRDNLPVGAQRFLEEWMGDLKVVQAHLANVMAAAFGKVHHSQL